jgi:hypothetical protein
MYFRIPEIQGFPKICILPRFEKLFFPRFFPCDVIAPSAAWVSPISGPGLNFKNSFGYYSNNIKKMFHEKFKGPMTFLLGCRGGPKIAQSLSSIKVQKTMDEDNGCQEDDVLCIVAWSRRGAVAGHTANGRLGNQAAPGPENKGRPESQSHCQMG